jgi:hypothetical protein
MIEEPRHEPGAERHRDEPQVWVCTFEWRDGIDVWVGCTEDLALEGLAAVCRLFWDEARAHVNRFVRDDGQQPFPATPPDDDRTVIELYFDVMNEASPAESYVIAPHTVVGGLGQGGVK